MTVYELIRRLAQYPAETRVVFQDFSEKMIDGKLLGDCLDIDSVGEAPVYHNNGEIYTAWNDPNSREKVVLLG